MSFQLEILTDEGAKQFAFEAGESVFIVGANGTGKTRLASVLEVNLGDLAHRISGHRVLSLDTNVERVSYEKAQKHLRYGSMGNSAAINYRLANRWQGNPYSAPLNDFGALLQTLFAEQSVTAFESHRNARSKNGVEPAATVFEKLVDIWDHIFPHRQLMVSSDDVQARAPGETPYSASQLSDGERSVFYLIGQTLLARPNSVIIFDEPELHIHRSILSRLWDELEAARPDCGMVFITHDLDFVATREGQKLVLTSYNGSTWSVERVPEDVGFSEEITTLILGSRRPVLFVEGGTQSIDIAIYRACYPAWTVIPRGSCEEVIHAVTTMRANAALTRVTCAGIVDADAYEGSEISLLNEKGIRILPVSEIENVFLMDAVSKAIASEEGFEGTELAGKLEAVRAELFDQANRPANQNPVIVRYCRRRIDRMLKRVDLSSAPDVDSLSKLFLSETQSLDIKSIASLAENGIREALAHKNVDALLKCKRRLRPIG